MNSLLTLQEAIQKLSETGIPIKYATLYQWAKRGIHIGEGKSIAIATQVGNRWFIYEAKLEEIINAVKSGLRIQVNPNTPISKKSETRGRKPGTRFGTYTKQKKKKSPPSGRRRSFDSNRMLTAKCLSQWKC